jgi:hypothetical protein
MLFYQRGAIAARFKIRRVRLGTVLEHIHIQAMHAESVRKRCAFLKARLDDEVGVAVGSELELAPTVDVANQSNHDRLRMLGLAALHAAVIAGWADPVLLPVSPDAPFAHSAPLKLTDKARDRMPEQAQALAAAAAAVTDHKAAAESPSPVLLSLASPPVAQTVNCLFC